MSKDIQFFKNPISEQRVIALVEAYNNSGGRSSLTTGSIFDCSINNAGSSYGGGYYTDVPLTGGSGTGATADITISNGGINGIQITNSGNGGSTAANYTNVPLTGGSGTGATANIEVTYIGSVGSIRIDDPGAGGIDGVYTNVPFAPDTIPFDASGLTGNVTIVGGIITNVTVTSGGSKYVDEQNVVPDPKSCGWIAGTILTAKDVITYGVTSVTIQNKGGGYADLNILSANKAEIGNVDGLAIEVEKVEAPGKFILGRIVNNGSGYETGDILSFNNSYTGNTGSGAEIKVGYILNPPFR